MLSLTRCLLPVVLTSVIAHADPAYKPAPGPHAVSTTDFTLPDAARDKVLPLRVLTPAPTPDHPGPFPLIVFSHGLGGSRDAFPDLTRHWASHGYVVILPTHADSIQLRREQGEDLSHLRTNIKALEKDADLPARVADITLIFDSLDAIEQKLGDVRGGTPLRGVPDSADATDDASIQDGVGGANVPPASVPPIGESSSRSVPPPLIDPSRIGMSGHSAGAFTTQLIFGVKTKGLLGAMRSSADPRIKAAILVSGQGANRRIFTKDSWSDIAKPMLVITGSKDTAVIGNETPQSRQDPFTYARPGDKYLLFIEGATHSSYSGQAPAMRLDPEQPNADTLKMIAAVTASGTLAFWDAHLKDDDAARKYLAGDDLQLLSDGHASLERK